MTPADGPRGGPADRSRVSVLTSLGGLAAVGFAILWIAAHYRERPEFRPSRDSLIALADSPGSFPKMESFPVELGSVAELVGLPLLLVLVLLAAWGIGRSPAFRWVPAARAPGSAALLAIGLGLGGSALVMLGFGALGVLGLPVLVGWTAVGLGSAGLALRRGAGGEWSGTFRAVREAYVGAPLAYSLLALALLGTLFLALGPETGADALTYHLHLPQVYLSEGRIVPIPLNAYSNMMLGVEMLFLWCMGIGGPVLAKLLHWSFGVGCALAMHEIGRRLLSRFAAAWAPVLLFTSPFVLREAMTASVDLALAFFFLGGVLGLLEYRETGERRWIAVAALFAGFTMSVKYIGILGAGALGALVVMGSSGGARLGACLLFIAIAALPVAPWLIKNALFTGNPVYPLLHSWFGGVAWDAERSRMLMAWMQSYGPGRGWLEFLKLPWALAVGSRSEFGAFDEAGSPLPWAFLPLAVRGGRGFRTARMGLSIAALLYVIGWFLGTQQLRFLLPAFALLCLLAAHVERAIADPVTPVCPVERDRTILPGRLRRWIVVAGTTLVALTTIVPTFVMGTRTLPYWLSEDGKETWKATEIRTYAAVQEINATLPPDSKLLLLWEMQGFYLERTFLADSFSRASSILAMVAESEDEHDLANRLRALGITHLLVNEKRLPAFAYYHTRSGGGPLGLGATYSRRPHPNELFRTLLRLRRSYLTPVYERDGVSVLGWRDPAPE